MAVEALAMGRAVLLSHALVHICREKIGSGVSWGTSLPPPHSPRCGDPSHSPSHTVPLASRKPRGHRHW